MSESDKEIKAHEHSDSAKCYQVWFLQKSWFLQRVPFLFNSIGVLAVPARSIDEGNESLYRDDVSGVARVSLNKPLLLCARFEIIENEECNRHPNANR